LEIPKGILKSFDLAGSMRRRMLFYLVLALVPMIVLSLYLAVDERNEEEARARAEETAIVNTVSSRLDRILQMNRSLVSALSFEQTDEKICPSLALLRRSLPQVFNLGMFNLKAGQSSAHMVCAALPAAADPFRLTDQELRLQATMRAPGDIAVGSIRNNTVNGGPVIPISSLVRVAEDGTRRLIAVTVSLETLGEQLGHVPIPAEATLLVLDRNGIVAARNPSATEWKVGSPASAFERDLPSLRRDFVGEVTGQDGVSRFYALAHSGGPEGLTVVLKIRSSDIFRRSRIRLAIHLLGLLIIIGLVFGIAWTNSDRFVARPMAELARVADRLAKGHLSERSGLEYKGEIGHLACSFDQMAEFLQQEEIRGARMLEALRALTARLASVGEEERTRIAREIHDELGQQLTAIRFEVARLDQSIAQRLAERGPALSDKVKDVAAMVDVAIRDVGKIATALRPVALDHGGLVDAIRYLAEDFERRTGIACAVHVPEPVEATGDLATCLFRICQESLTNVARHAEATAVEIRINSDPACLTVTVRDNGLGFEPGSEAQTSSAAVQSLGLLGMRERARMAGGILSVISAPGEGTTILAWIPASGGTQAGDALAAFV